MLEPTDDQESLDQKEKWVSVEAKEQVVWMDPVELAVPQVFLDLKDNREPEEPQEPTETPVLMETQDHVESKVNQEKPETRDV